MLHCGVALAVGADAARAGSALDAFVPLESVVRVPLDSLAEPWRPVSFTAQFTKSNGLDASVPGLALRIPSGVVAFCAYCPHEFCRIDLNANARELQCPCHGGRFDPQRGGARLSGPPPRSTYRFKYSLSRKDLVIVGIEAELERRLR